MRFLLMMATAAATALAPSVPPAKTPLYIAMEDMSLDEVRHALATGSSARETFGPISMPALILAVTENRLDLAAALLDAGADINVRIHFGDVDISSMHAAASAGHLDMLTFLMSRGAQVDITTNEGSTPLAVAVDANQVDSVALLAAHGANLNSKNSYGETPLHRAVMGGHPEVARELLRLGANPNETNADGRTPFQEVAATQSLSADVRSALQGMLQSSGNVTPAASQPPAPQAPENPCDVGTAARRIQAANPKIKPRMLYGAVRQWLELAGCIQPAPVVVQQAPAFDPPPKALNTYCYSIGNSTNCTTR